MTDDAVNGARKKGRGRSILTPMTTAISGLVAVLSLGCAVKTVRGGPVVRSYARATCIPAGKTQNMNPPKRAWNDEVVLADGSRARVVGVQWIGGGIAVEFESDHVVKTAAKSGDYIYPSDVRIDHATDHLFVKTSGISAWRDEPYTWLFEYDLRGRKEVNSVRVDPTSLPQECPDRSSTSAAGSG